MGFKVPTHYMVGSPGNQPALTSGEVQKSPSSQEIPLLLSSLRKSKDFRSCVPGTVEKDLIDISYYESQYHNNLLSLRDG